MYRTYKFRLYPNKAEEERLLWTLEQCRCVYNTLLMEMDFQEKPNKAALQAMLPIWKERCPELKNVYSKALQYEVYRLFSNLWGLAQSKKNGRKVGRLRFKGKGWFKTFTYNQYGFKIEETDTRLSLLHLSKIGDIPIMVHRPIDGNIKQITIKHVPSGKWFAFVQADDCIVIPEKQTIESAVGIDVCLTNFAVDSDALALENPRWLKKSLKKLRHEQRKLSRAKKGSNNRTKQRLRVARVHERTANQRDDFLHKVSRYYVDNYDLISTEDLSIGGMIKNRHLSQSIMDASWGKLNSMLSYKAENAGKTHVQVRAAGTTQECSVCGAVAPKALWNRKHRCPKCGIVMPRDYNSSLNILQRGLEKVGMGQAKLTPVDTEPLRELVTISASSVVEAGSHNLKPSGVLGHV